jgi:hypothetical protein
MTDENRETARFLLEQARKLRALAVPHIPTISDELLALAEALENRARSLGDDD